MNSLIIHEDNNTEKINKFSQNLQYVCNTYRYVWIENSSFAFWNFLKSPSPNIFNYIQLCNYTAIFFVILESLWKFSFTWLTNF